MPELQAQALGDLCGQLGVAVAGEELEGLVARRSPPSLPPASERHAAMLMTPHVKTPDSARYGPWWKLKYFRRRVLVEGVRAALRASFPAPALLGDPQHLCVGRAACTREHGECRVGGGRAGAAGARTFVPWCVRRPGAVHSTAIPVGA